MKSNNKLLLEMIDEELSLADTQPRKEPHDHEGRMAKGELRNMIKNGLTLYKLIGKDDELPGWVSSYISLANDYMNSVSQFMVEDKIGEDFEEETEDEIDS